MQIYKLSCIRCYTNWQNVSKLSVFKNFTPDFLPYCSEWHTVAVANREVNQNQHDQGVNASDTWTHHWLHSIQHASSWDLYHFTPSHPHPGHSPHQPHLLTTNGTNNSFHHKLILGHLINKAPKDCVFHIQIEFGFIFHWKNCLLQW